MSFADQIATALHAAQRDLARLGEKPKGDVAGMKGLARALRAEAQTVSTEASSARAVPRSVVFNGPGRAGLDGQAAQISWALQGVVDQLEGAAARVDAEAAKIDREQKQWARDRKRLQGLVASLGAQLRSAR